MKMREWARINEDIRIDSLVVDSLVASVLTRKRLLGGSPEFIEGMPAPIPRVDSPQRIEKEGKVENKTLTYSEQKAYDVVLKLRELGMVPNYSWRAVDPGRVEDAGYDEGFGGNWKIKKREVVFEWGWKKQTQRIVLKLVLRGEIPLMRVSPDEEMQDEAAQKRWFVVSIHIDLLEKDGHHPREVHPAEFKLEGMMAIDFLFNGLKGAYFNL